jgi:lysophospholipase L1-like esterase
MMAEGSLDNEHTRFWKTFAQNEAVPLIDLSPAFVEPGISPEETYAKYFISGDFHWNDEGNQRVAGCLAPEISQKIESAKRNKTTQ